MSGRQPNPAATARWLALLLLAFFVAVWTFDDVRYTVDADGPMMVHSRWWGLSKKSYPVRYDRSERAWVADVNGNKIPVGGDDAP
jgi:hypothetical protein